MNRDLKGQYRAHIDNNMKIFGKDYKDLGKEIELSAIVSCEELV